MFLYNLKSASWSTFIQKYYSYKKPSQIHDKISKKYETLISYLMKQLYADGARCLFSGASNDHSMEKILLR